MTKTANPFAEFDVTKFAAAFDPTKAFEDFAKASAFKMPQVDVDAFVKAQQKNLKAMEKANQAAVEAVRTIAARQNEIVKGAVEEATAAVDSLKDVKTPQDAVAKQTEIFKGAFETAVANTQEIAKVVAESNATATKVLNARVVEGLDEIKAIALKVKA